MSGVFRQHSAVTCFYCQSDVTPLPRNPRSFKCPHCDCWNRYKPNGEILSDEPAMHDESLNTRSFARRASPRKDRLPNMYGSALFCRTCQTNQMLLANLLSNYLPPPDHPDYEQRAARFPEYHRSIEARYPPVCADCAPAVEEEIRKRDNIARTHALGGFLGASHPQRRHVVRTQHDRDKFARQIFWWKVRGCLWATSLACVIAGYSLVASGYVRFNVPGQLQLGVPILAFISILWTAWDPTYGTLKRAEYQGRAIRQRGKREYNVLQVMIWLSRCSTALLLASSWCKSYWEHLDSWADPDSPRIQTYCIACVVLELTIHLRCYLALRLERPPPVHLTESPSQLMPSLTPTSASVSRGTTPAIEPDLLAPLTLSSNPVVIPPTAPSHPVFGVPSFPGAQTTSTTPDYVPSDYDLPDSTMDAEDDEDDLHPRRRDPDAMDWSPTIPSPQKPHPHTRMEHPDDSTWLRPQRFFAPEEPTGLENLFSTTIRLSDDGQTTNGREVAQKSKRGLSGWLHTAKLWRR